MTINQAFEFFAKYGNVCSDPEKLKSKEPTISQLREAVNYALRNGQPEILCTEALETVLDHYLLK